MVPEKEKEKKERKKGKRLCNAAFLSSWGS